MSLFDFIVDISNHLSVGIRISWLFLLQSKTHPPPKECPGYETMQHLIVRIQFWWKGESVVPLHYHYSHDHSASEMKYVTLPSMVKKIFQNYSYSISPYVKEKSIKTWKYNEHDSLISRHKITLLIDIIKINRSRFVVDSTIFLLVYEAV